MSTVESTRAPASYEVRRDDAVTTAAVASASREDIETEEREEVKR